MDSNKKNGIDYEETFAPIACQETIKILISLETQKKCVVTVRRELKEIIPDSATRVSTMKQDNLMEAMENILDYIIKRQLPFVGISMITEFSS